jgi:hypothetical protein
MNLVDRQSFHGQSGQHTGGKRMSGGTHGNSQYLSGTDVGQYLKHDGDDQPQRLSLTNDGQEPPKITESGEPDDRQ